LFAAAPGTVEYIKSGRLRALAVTSATDAEVLKELPTIASAVPGYEASQWYGLAAPAKTPLEIVEHLNREANAAFTEPAMRARFTSISGEPIAGTPAQFAALMADETEKWAKVVKFAGLTVE